jgi:gamma-glutamyltranspeptidase/glutathione hydrolase
MKLALSDRDAYVTDPDHMHLAATGLISPQWIQERRTLIDAGRAGDPVPGRPASGGTVYLCAADADGMLVSLIQSNYVGFGSGVTVPGWGINLQNRGSYFSLDPGHVNVIAGGKRTMHTLIPAMAFRGGEPWLVFGSMGGDGQAQTHLQLLTRIVVDGEDVQRAIDAPRWVTSPRDWSVRAESRFDGAVLDGLRDRGHEVREVGPYDVGMGHAHAIEIGDGYAAGTDPRAEGAALGL